MDPTTAQALADRLHLARRERREVERLTLEHPDFSMADAYAIQEAGLAARHREGERTIGLKMGLTSEAKRQQMGLEAPVFGELTDRMQLADGGVLQLAEGIHAKIEPEIAFRVGPELRGPITLAQAAEAVTGVAPAMEILDSRYRDFKYFSLPDVVADNSSSYRFVVGAWRPLGELQLDQLPMAMSVNGVVKQEALGSAISGHPLISLVQLCELLSARGRAVPAGCLILAGAATVAEKLQPGDRISLSIEGLGSVSMSAA